MQSAIDVGDRLIGIDGGWHNEIVEVIFVAPAGNIGDVRLKNGEEAAVHFMHFRKHNQLTPELNSTACSENNSPCSCPGNKHNTLSYHESSEHDIHSSHT